MRTDGRKNSIDAINADIGFWNTDAGNGYTGFQNISQLIATVETPGCSPRAGSCPCYTGGTITLKPTDSPTDIYTDGQNEISTYTQLRYSGQISNFPQTSPTALQTDGGACQIVVSIYKNNLLLSLNATPLVTVTAENVKKIKLDVSRTGPKSCPTSLRGSTIASSDYKACKSNCDSYNGEFIWTQKAANYDCYVQGYPKELCQRLAYNNKSSTWGEENSRPAQGSGCFTPSDTPSPFRFTTVQTTTNFQRNILVSVRAARDPYLKYLALTEGSGGLGLSQEQKATAGLACIILGTIFMVVWGCVCFYGVRMVCHRPEERPTGYMDSMAYDMFSRFGKRPGTVVPPQGYQQVGAPGYPVQAPVAYPPPPPAAMAPSYPPPQQYGPPQQWPQQQQYVPVQHTIQMAAPMPVMYAAYPPPPAAVPAGMVYPPPPAAAPAGVMYAPLPAGYAQPGVPMY